MSSTNRNPETVTNPAAIAGALALRAGIHWRPNMLKAFYADCNQFDNSRTGFYATAEEAEAAFWLENTFSDQERARVVVYTREVTIGEDEREQARYLAANGSPSPAIDLDTTGEIGASTNV